MTRVSVVVLLAAMALTVGACHGSPDLRPNQGRGVANGAGTAIGAGTGYAARSGLLRAVATTSLVGDVVRAVGGDAVAVTVLLPTGSDPHSFDSAPRDVAAVADADVVFANGLGLEAFLDPLLANAGGGGLVVAVSDGVATMALDEPAPHGGGLERKPEAGDPHVWFDPGNVIAWTRNIQAALSGLSPADAGLFAANAEDYRTRLNELDGWIQVQVATVSDDRRQIVTDHQVLGYFCRRYGFRQVGTVVPGLSAAAEPSARDVAELEDLIRQSAVRAVFVGTSVNPSLAERVAEDTGVRLVRIYTGSLSEPGGPAGSYEAFMRYNVAAIVDALK